MVALTAIHDWVDAPGSVVSWAPSPACAAKVAQATEVHGTYDDVPSDANVRTRHIPGIKEQEGVIEVRGVTGTTLIFNDMITNVAKAKPPIDWFVGPTGQVSIPRFARWLWNNDKAALRSAMQAMVNDGATRVIPGHGDDIVDSSAATLADRLGPDFALTGQSDEKHPTPFGTIQDFTFAAFRRR